MADVGCAGILVADTFCGPMSRLPLTLTLSVDHRIVSGRYAGEFLGAIVKELESM